MENLNYQTLEKLGYAGYLKRGGSEKVLQFGEGNFLRAFVDYFFDVCNEKGTFDGRIVLVQPIAPGLAGPINAQQGLSFDAGHLLGYPAPAFLVFDSRNRKIAACDVVNDAYKVHDFSWLLGWRMTWREVESMEMNGGSRQVNASGMSVPTFERTVRAKDFAVELQTADPQQPLLSFPMSRRAAETWCARLNALFNG